MATLHPKVFSKEPEKLPIRKGFGEGLLLAAKKDERIVGLCADLTESTQMHLFKNEFPERFIEIGVAEQNLASVASGMAAMGKIPFISSYAMFSPGRNWEQIRTTICYNDRPVVVVGSHAGISVGPDGGTHQAIEDIAIMRVIPRMTVVVPCDASEARKATLALASFGHPAYLRLAREKTPLITTEETPFEIGKAYELFSGEGKEGIGIIASGSIMHNALLVAKKLSEEGVGVTLLNLHTIKPLDTQSILSLAKKYGRILVCEEHQIVGGVGSAVAEYLAGVYPVHIGFIGVQDLFGQSGTPDELIEHYGMGFSAILDKARMLLKQKRIQ